MSRAGTENVEAATSEYVDMTTAEFVPSEPGQYVARMDVQGDETGEGKVHQVQGKWQRKNLEESGTCGGCNGAQG